MQDHNNQLRKIFLHDTLYAAFIISTLPNEENEQGESEQHFVIYFDTSPPDVHGQRSLLAEIVGADEGGEGEMKTEVKSEESVTSGEEKVAVKEEVEN